MWLSQVSRKTEPASGSVCRDVPRMGCEFAAIAADHIPVAGQS